MANTSYVITLQSPRGVSDLARFIRDTTDSRNQSILVSGLFGRLANGTESGNFDIQTSTAAPVRASQTFTLVYGSLVSGSSTAVIGGTTLTGMTSPSGQVQWGIGANLAAATANLAAAINANTTLNKYCYAAVTGTGVVTVKANAPGVIGNFVTTTATTGVTAGGATLLAGAGGSESAPVNFSRGL